MAELSFSNEYLDALIAAIDRRRKYRQAREALLKAIHEGSHRFGIPEHISAIIEPVERAPITGGARHSWRDKEAARQHARNRKDFLRHQKALKDAHRSLTADELAQLYWEVFTPLPKGTPLQSDLPEEGLHPASLPRSTHADGSEAHLAPVPGSVFGSMRRWLSALLQRGGR